MSAFAYTALHIPLEAGVNVSVFEAGLDKFYDGKSNHNRRAAYIGDGIRGNSISFIPQRCYDPHISFPALIRRIDGKQNFCIKYALPGLKLLLEAEFVRGFCTVKNFNPPKLFSRIKN